MAKRKTQNNNNVVVDEIPDIAQKQNIEPSFVVSDKSKLKTKTRFDEIRVAIENLEIGKCVIVTKNKNDNSMFELKRKLSNIVFGHARKHVDKRFETGQTDAITFEILRTK